MLGSHWGTESRSPHTCEGSGGSQRSTQAGRTEPLFGEEWGSPALKDLEGGPAMFYLTVYGLGYLFIKSLPKHSRTFPLPTYMPGGRDAKMREVEPAFRRHLHSAKCWQTEGTASCFQWLPDFSILGHHEKKRSGANLFGGALCDFQPNGDHKDVAPPQKKLAL